MDTLLGFKKGDILYIKSKSHWEHPHIPEGTFYKVKVVRSSPETACFVAMDEAHATTLYADELNIFEYKLNSSNFKKNNIGV